MACEMKLFNRRQRHTAHPQDSHSYFTMTTTTTTTTTPATDKNDDDKHRNSSSSSSQNDPTPTDNDNDDSSHLDNELMTEQLQDLQLTLASVSQEMETEFESIASEQQPKCWKASAVGGFMSLAQNVAVRAATKQKKIITGDVWDKALQAAKKSAEVHRNERSFHANDMQLLYVAGDAASAKHIGFVIHGFMTADQEDVSLEWTEWAATLDMVLYRICWPTGTVDGWKTFADKAFKNNNKGNNNNNNNNKVSLINPDWFSQLTSNPWHVAQDKTAQVGAVLARFLERAPTSLKRYKENGGTVSLIGHSLGGAIVFQTLLQLQQQPIAEDSDAGASSQIMVDHAICLGSAFVPPAVDKIQNVLTNVQKKYVNVYSKHDQVLQVVFRAANANVHPAAGNIPIVITKQLIDERSRTTIMDLDVTDRIPANDKTHYGHTYASVLPWLAKKLKDILFDDTGDNDDDDGLKDETNAIVQNKTTVIA